MQNPNVPRALYYLEDQMFNINIREAYFINREHHYSDPRRVAILVMA